MSLESFGHKISTSATNHSFRNSPSEYDFECFAVFSLTAKLACTIFSASNLFLKILFVAQLVPFPESFFAISQLALKISILKMFG
jgi:hypothetical protein